MSLSESAFKSIDPESRGIIPRIHCKRVDLPQPLAPKRPYL